MRLGKYLSSLTKPELEEIIEFCNLSEEEKIIFNMLSTRKSIIEISDKSMLAERTVKRRIKAISEKVERSDKYCQK